MIAVEGGSFGLSKSHNVKEESFINWVLAVSFLPGLNLLTMQWLISILAFQRANQPSLVISIDEKVQIDDNGFPFACAGEYFFYHLPMDDSDFLCCFG